MTNAPKRRARGSVATRLLRVVYGLYVAVVVCMTAGQMFFEYQYQKKNISTDFLNIQSTFEPVLAGQIWNLDEEALRSTLSGMIKLPSLVGVTLQDLNGNSLATAGTVVSEGVAGGVGLHVGLAGRTLEETKIHRNDLYPFEMFESSFPITYTLNNETKHLGHATIYSNTTVIWRRTRLSFLLLGLTAALQMVLLWLIFVWFSNHILKKPLSALAAAARSVTLENLDTVKMDVSSRSRDELSALAESFNFMIDGLRDAIAKRNAMNVSLRESEEKFRSYIMHAPNGIFVTNRKGDYVEVNVAAETITGYSREELLQMNITDLIAPEDQEKGLQHFNSVVQDGKAFSELNYLTKDKAPKIWAVSAVALSPDSFLGFVRDITEQKSLEEQFRQSQKMEAVGQMAGGVAHDFNNLLQVICGYAEMAEMELSPEDKLTPSLVEISKAAQRGKGLINQLLAFSRRQVIQPVDLDINRAIDSLLKMISGLIGENMELDFIKGRELGTVHADQGLFEQVLMNLCVNARDAMPDGGKLTIETENVLIDGEYARINTWATSGRYVLLSITDTGCGMSPQTLEKVFEPFFTTKEVGKGTGLGLSTVFGIVTQHNGHVNVYSEPEKGTLFKIYLPTVERKATEISRKVPGPAIGGTETILIAEDDEMVLTLAEHLLKMAGYTVLTATDGEEAITMFEKNADEIDVAIFDVVMPRMGGKEAMDRILKIRPGLPHLFASGYSENAVHTNFIQKQGLHLINKPYQAETLLCKIREVLDKK
jgi:PAS domain S-box-containing protein